MLNFEKKALLFFVLLGGSFFYKAYGADNTEKNFSQNDILIIGATSEQQKAFEMSRQKIHDQWQHIRVAGALEDAGEYKAATEEYKIALKLAKTKGDTAVPLSSLIEVYEKNGDYQSALETLDRLILLKPSLATQYAERKQNLFQQIRASESN